MRRKVWFFMCLLLTAVMAKTEAPAQERTVDEETVRENAEDTKQPENAETEKESLFGTFETITLEGEEANQDIFAEADLSMVNIWATYCGPCIREMPDLGVLAGKYEEQGFQIIGIIADVAEAEEEDAVAIVEYTQADYTHLLMSADLLQSYVGQVQVVPTTVFVDKEGKQVGEVYAGSRSEEEWATIIEELLKEQDDEE